ncbi:MAG: hypothetical protein ACE5FH_09955, partial [Candidatus Zixiibacteriota bacterium]
ATRLPMDTTTVLSFDVIFGSELDNHRNAWFEGIMNERTLNPNTNSGLYTLELIKTYLERIGCSLPADFDLLQEHFEKLNAITLE